MAQADDHRVPLNVVSVQLGKDALPSGDEGLPATYPVMLGISRPITAYELAELASPTARQPDLIVVEHRDHGAVPAVLQATW